MNENDIASVCSLCTSPGVVNNPTSFFHCISETVFKIRIIYNGSGVLIRPAFAGLAHLTVFIRFRLKYLPQGWQKGPSDVPIVMWINKMKASLETMGKHQHIRYISKVHNLRVIVKKLLGILSSLASSETCMAFLL